MQVEIFEKVKLSIIHKYLTSWRLAYVRSVSKFQKSVVYKYYPLLLYFLLLTLKNNGSEV